VTRTIHVAHSPDSDDAFMFYALAEGKLDTGDLRYEHELSDIESLNRRALTADLEVSAVSIHAYAHLHRTYSLLASGSSMGDGYGPRLVSKSPAPTDPRTALRGLRVASRARSPPPPWRSGSTSRPSLKSSFLSTRSRTPCTAATWTSVSSSTRAS